MTTRFADHLLTDEHANRPAANTVPTGTLFACSDHDLVYQSDGSAWATWLTAGGGNGGGGGDVPKGSLFAGIDHLDYFAEVYGPDEGFDEEFDAVNTAALPSGWGWVNQGSAAYEEIFGAGRIDFSGGGGTQNWQMIVQSLPAADEFTAYAHLWGMFADTTGGQYTPSLILRESSSQKIAMLEVFTTTGNVNTSVPQVFIGRNDDPTTQDSPTTYGSGGRFVRPWLSNQWYMRIRKHADNDWDFAVNNDGGCWFFVGGLNVDLSVEMVPDQIGFGHSGSASKHTGCEWLRIRDIV